MSASPDSATSLPRETVWTIQWLRGVAAFMVLLFHARRFLTESTAITYDSLAPYSAGVDIFFIISGFVMAYTTASSARPIDFLVRRVIRVFPLYLVALFTLAAVREWSINERFLLSIVLWPIDKDVPLTLGFPYLVPGWTLRYELFYYGVFGACLLLPRFRTAACTLVLGALVLAPALLGADVVLDPRQAHTFDASLLSLATSPILLEFIAGMALAEWYKTPSRINRKAGVGIGIVLAVGGLAIFCTGIFRLHGMQAAGWVAFIIVWGCLLIERNLSIPTFAPLTSLGAASYSLYLFHVPVFQFIQRHTSLGKDMWTFLAAVALATIVGFVAYALAEKPITNALKSGWKKYTSNRRLFPRSASPNRPGIIP